MSAHFHWEKLIAPHNFFTKSAFKFTVRLPILLPFLLLATLRLGAQDFLGYSHSNYAGIAGAAYNPASLADHRYSMDILAAGFSVELGNNYVGVKRGELRNPGFGPQHLYLRERNTKKAVFFRNEILLPGIMFSNEKFGWGVDLRVRTYANVDGISPELAHIFVNEFNDEPIFGQDLYNRHLGVTVLSWAELGGTYARTIWSGAEHFVSVGARPKLLLGLASAYAFLNDAGYQFHNDSTLTIYDADFQFAHSDQLAFSSSFQPSYKLGFHPGVGADIGIVYEHRPEALQNDKNNQFKPWPGFRERPEYQYRLGASITDLGIIHFRSGEISDHYTVDANSWDLDDVAFDSTSPPPLQSTFKLRTGSSNSGEPYWMRLPLALNLQYDQRIAKDVYVNATSFTALYLRNNNGKKVHELTRLTVTPRWEKRWFGVWSPLSFSRLGTFSMGAGVRLGPLVVGTNDIWNFALRNKKIYSADIYALLKVPLFPLPGKKSKKGKQNTGSPIDECPD